MFLLGGIQMLKRVVSIGIGLSMLLSMSAFAITSSTTTTYKDGKITVTTNVSGLESGSKVTYLAFKNNGNNIANLADADITYIDQATLNSGETSKTFTYVTTDAKIASKVMVGGSAVTTPYNDEIPGYVTVVDASERVLAAGQITTDSESFEASSLVKVALDTAVNVSGITSVNGNADALCFMGNAKEMWIAKSDINTNGATKVVVTINDTPEISNLGLNGTSYDNVVAASAFGQVIGSPAEFGVAFSLDKSLLEAESVNVTSWGEDVVLGEKNVVAFPSLGKNGEGQFVVQLADSGLSGRTLYARIYTKDSEGTYSFSANTYSLTR